MMCQVFHAPTMIWSSVLGPCVIMRGEPLDDAVLLLAWSCAAPFAWSQFLRLVSLALPSSRHYAYGIISYGVRHVNAAAPLPDTRRRQSRFRKDPGTYLAQIKARLLQT